MKTRYVLTFIVIALSSMIIWQGAIPESQNKHMTLWPTEENTLAPMGSSLPSVVPAPPQATKKALGPKKLEANTERAAEDQLKLAFEPHVRKWIDFDGDLFMIEKRARLAEELARDTAFVKLAGDVTLDPKRTKDVFGDEQANARVLALRVVIEAAKREGPSRIEELARAVAIDVAAGSEVKGRGVDLTDLIEGWMRAVGVEELVNQPRLISDRLVIKRSLIVPYLRAFEYVYGKKMEDPKFPVRLAFEEAIDHES